MGKPVIMGRKTFDSIGRVLDGRDVIVVTRSPSFAAEGVHVARNLEAALTIGAERAAARGVDEVFIGGGGEIYRQAFMLADRLYLTEVDAAPAGDTKFPEVDARHWREVSREKLPRSEGDTATAEQAIFDRRR
jgi:dihydrofolate reductase